MPPRARFKVARDPTVTRITRADARADPAVQAAVDATALASRGLAELLTAEETAAIEASVVKARNERESQSKKKKKKKGSDVPTEETEDPKDDDPKDGDPKGNDPQGDNPKKDDPKEDDKTKKGPKKRETKKEREERKAKEKAEKAEAAEAAAAAAAIEAVEAAKALEAVKALEAAEKAKKIAEEEAKKKADEEATKKAGADGPIAESVSSEEEWLSAKSGGNKTKSKSGGGSAGKGGKAGGPSGATGPGDGGGGGVHIPDPPTSIDPGDDGTYDDTPKITGTELQRRLLGVDWEALGEKLSTELFNFVRNGGFVDQWKKMREEKAALDDLTEAIGYEFPEGGTEEDDSGEDTSDEYNKGLEGGDEPETEDTEDGPDEPDEKNGDEPESEPDQEKGDEPKADSDPDSEDEEDYDPEDEASTSETNTDTTESEADAGKEDGEEPINPFMFCCIAPDSPVGCYKQRCIPKPPPSSANKTGKTPSGGSIVKPSTSDAKKMAGKKRKAEDSPEQTPPPETDDEDDSRLPPISCWWPPSYDTNRWDIGATTAVSVPQDPPTAKTRSGKKRKAEDSPEQTPPKKAKLDEGAGGMTTKCPGPGDDFRRTIISCPGPSTSVIQGPTTAKTRSGKKRKAEDSPEQTTPKKAKLDEGAGGISIVRPGPDYDPRRTIISYPGPRNPDTRRTTRAKKAVLKDPPKAKKGAKRVSFKTPEQSAAKKKKSDETPMCKLPPLKPHKWDSILKEPVKVEKSAGTKRKSTTEPDEKRDTKKRKRGETLVCALPESSPMESKREEEPKRSKVRTRRRGGFV
ncbi:hypothetical protein O988_07178 [Pseudogymnoascus sp. VKM F-3808]|nr:hypothetical protein O988_07178 [Pseudogymnoascus sp. VKM F-3808]